MKRTEEKPTPLPAKIEQMLTEARVILPGAQETLHRSFEELAASSRLIHMVSLCAVALAVILLMTPAALHRITFAGEDTPRFFRIGSVFVIAAPLPLALGIAGDLYVATAKAAESTALGAGLGIGALVVLVTLWYALPLMLRGNSLPAKQLMAQARS
jgi:hypothetical protein